MYKFLKRKKKQLQSRVHYLVRVSFRIEGQIKNFSDKQKLKEFNNTEPTLKEMLTDFSKWKKKCIEKGKSQYKRQMYSKD